MNNHVKFIDQKLKKCNSEVILVCFEELVELVFKAGVFKPVLGQEGAVEIQEDISPIDELTCVELGELLEKKSEEIVNFDEVLELAEAHAVEVLRLEQLQACLSCVELWNVFIRKLNCA